MTYPGFPLHIGLDESELSLLLTFYQELVVVSIWSCLFVCLFVYLSISNLWLMLFVSQMKSSIKILRERQPKNDSLINALK